MKLNHPVTEREILMKEGTISVTRTDLKGNIIYANEDFIEISGFSQEELLGQNHNIVRHPEMPPEAFADLWGCLKAGKPWRGLIKNRTKSGDFYWVDANVTPVFENGQLAGYLSARYVPTRQQIQHAELLYQKISQKTAKMRPTQWLSKLNLVKRLNITNKIALLIILLVIPTLLLTYFCVAEKDANIDFAKQELKGLEYITPLKQLLTLVVDHRTVTDNNLQHLGFKDASWPSIEQNNYSINEAIKVVDAVNSRYGSIFDSNEKWQKIVGMTQQLVQPGQLSSDANIEQHTVLLEQISDLLVYISDQSNLTLDPEADSYYLMMLVSVRLPELVDYISEFKSANISNAAKGSELADNAKTQIAILNQRLKNRYKKVKHDLSAIYQANSEHKTLLLDKENAFSSQLIGLLDRVQRDIYMANPIAATPEQIAENGTAALNTVNSLYDATNSLLKTRLQARIDNFEYSKSLQLSMVFAVILLVLLFAFFIARYLVKSLLEATRLFTMFAEGNLRNTINLDGYDEFGNLFRGMQSMQVNLNVNLAETREQAIKAIRVERALDNVNSCVMLANNNFEVIYMNKAVKAMFKNAEADIRKVMPEFTADQVLGTNIDKYHQNAAHQRTLLSKLETSYQSAIEIGGRSLTVAANPVKDQEGVRIGTVVEWLDRTLEVKIEKDIEAIVESVKAGQLSSRLDLADKHGFFLKLSEGINELSTVIESVFYDINSTMQNMAEGDLTRRITSDYQGVYLNCKNDINATIEKLSASFGQIIESASYINNCSQEIASGNNNLSQRAEQQAANLEQTAASMEQLTSTVKNTANNAQQANQLATQARQLAEKGGQVVDSAVAAMQEINESSNRIANIIGVIDEIAFQTNLLALNASVEAARAGEQGRGFSVVATEVRNLAQRSATAAKESKDLIQNSVAKVRNGTEYVNETGKALSDIVLGVKKVGDIIAEIAAASVQQSAGIGQVNQAISQMDEITQQNAALAEQASAASVSMSDLSTNMVDLLTFFRIDDKAENSNSSMSFAKHQPTTGHQPIANIAIKKPSHQPHTDDDWQDF